MNPWTYYTTKMVHACTDILPHAEDSGPSGRPSFRLGTLRGRGDVVCSYPSIDGELDFWSVADWDGAVYIGEDVSENVPDFNGTVETFPAYKRMEDARQPSIHSTDDYYCYKVYPPRVRCSRLAFVGGLGYQGGYTQLPEHELDSGPTPSAEKFFGWFGYDTKHQHGLIDMNGEEGWGRPAFPFTPIAMHADQEWAYAPAEKQRRTDWSPEHGTTTIPAGAFEYVDYAGRHRNVGYPSDDVDIDNWWLLAMIRFDPRHAGGCVSPLYWNTDVKKTLSFFGGEFADWTSLLYKTILHRIYSANCITSDITGGFDGIPFPPGFLADCRIMADTYECKYTNDLADASHTTVHEFPAPVARDNNPARKSNCVKGYMGTHFRVKYRCPFPIWRSV